MTREEFLDHKPFVHKRNIMKGGREYIYVLSPDNSSIDAKKSGQPVFRYHCLVEKILSNSVHICKVIVDQPIYGLLAFHDYKTVEL